MDTFVLGLTAIVVAAISLPFNSEVEWIFHKAIHEPKWMYLFERHLSHHRDFSAQGKYRRRIEGEGRIILTRWGYFVLIPAVSLPYWAVAYWVAQQEWEVSSATAWTIAATATIFNASYYALFEYVHWCMHNPKGRWLEHQPFFTKRDAAHHAHHKRWGTNLTVLCRWADRWHGTYCP